VGAASLNAIFSMVVLLFQFLTLPHNLGQNVVYLVMDLIVDETDDGVSAFLQIGCAVLVVLNLRCVTIAVNLDYQFTRQAAEIDDAVPDRVLAAKPQTAELFTT
jgi:hypothetical protein